MSDIRIMKAVEYEKLPAKFKKAHPFEGLRAEGYWLQKKYDGCFGMAIIDRHQGSRMLSRTGEDYTPSCRHILRELENAALDRGMPEPFVVLGEVWQAGLDFPAISGKFRRQAESDLAFVANDLLDAGLETSEPYAARHNMLLHLIGSDCCWIYCSAAETWKGGQWDGTGVETARIWKEEGGFDGAILRNPNAGYTIGLVKNGEIIKVKPVMSLDLCVDDIHVNKGERTGRDVFTIDVTYRGVTTRVGSGVPHAFSAGFKAGAIVEVEFMGFTEDDKLREPRFKGIRHDKEKPDE